MIGSSSTTGTENLANTVAAVIKLLSIMNIDHIKRQVTLAFSVSVFLRSNTSVWNRAILVNPSNDTPALDLKKTDAKSASHLDPPL